MIWWCCCCYCRFFYCRCCCCWCFVRHSKWKKNGNTLRTETAKAVHNVCAPLWSPSSVFCFSDLFNYANKTEWRMRAPPNAQTHIHITKKHQKWNAWQNVLPICECAKVQVYPLTAWLYTNDIHPIHTFYVCVYFYIKHFFLTAREISVFMLCCVVSSSSSPLL